ncbi:MAG: prenyltransferase/squalene oxidase repeat-containing protein [Pirellulales bacterium]
MNTTDLVHFSPAEAPIRPSASRLALAPSRYELAPAVRQAIVHARQYLSFEQRVDGSWAGATTGDIASLSQLVLLFAFLGRQQDDLCECSRRAISRRQRAGGGWLRTPDGEFDLDGSVLVYFALKLVGEDACSTHMADARRAIRAHGGADRCSERARRWFALLGQIDYELCTPAMPEWLLASSLAQDSTSHELLDLAIRSVVWAVRPRRKIDLKCGVRELFVDPPRNWTPAQRDGSRLAAPWKRFWSSCERAGLVPFRRRALERASFLLTEAAVESPFVDLSFEELAWQWIALSALGFRDSCRAIRACERRLEMLIAVDETSDEARSQPTTTLTADTSLALAALAESGLGRDQAVVASGVRWILEHRAQAVRATAKAHEMLQLLRALTATQNDCAAADSSLPPKLRVLDDCDSRSAALDLGEVPSTETIQQGVDRLVSCLSVEQRPDGGWSDSEFARGLRNCGVQHAAGRRCGASTAELTGDVLESITTGGIWVRAVCERSIARLRTLQLGDGSWDSATHARFVYGTSSAVRGLIAAGVSADDSTIAHGVNWLVVNQCESGGWGEAGGNGDELASAEATSIQTAWAVAALVAAGMADHDATRRGIDYLLDAQCEAGEWCDEALVERDVANGPWYQNRLHSTSWSLLALAKWLRAIDERSAEPATALRLVCDDSAR